MPADVWPHRDGALDQARAELGDARFAAERGRGAAMSVDDAVTYALDALGALGHVPRVIGTGSLHEGPRPDLAQ